MLDPIRALAQTNAELTSLINEIAVAESALVKANKEYQEAELDLDNEKANWMIGIKDRDPKLTVQMLEAKETAEYHMQEKKLLAKKDEYKQKEIKYNHLVNAFSAAKRLLELQASINNIKK